MGKPKLAIIGGGPCGLMTAGAVGDAADVTIYERCSVMGGQWAYSEPELEATGSKTSSMYNCLWTNIPKESFELPNHHFPEGTPSFIKRPVMYEYLKAYAKKYNLMKKFKFNSKVANVVYDDESEKFKISVEHKDVQSSELYDYVAVANGHFTVPHNPIFPGEDSFPGKIVHVQDFEDGKLYINKRILIIGGSFSAEDIALQCWKYGVAHTDITHRRFEGHWLAWPSGIRERPILTHIEGAKVHFKDGTSGEYDVIIKCTGYLHEYPFMSDDLKLKTINRWVPDGLYRQCVLINNPKVFYIGMQFQCFTMSLFQLQGYLVRDVINGKISLPEKKIMIESYLAEREEESKLSSPEEMVSFQGQYMDLLGDMTGEEGCNRTDVFMVLIYDKLDDILTYRDKPYKNTFSGKIAELNDVLWIQDTDP